MLGYHHADETAANVAHLAEQELAIITTECRVKKRNYRRETDKLEFACAIVLLNHGFSEQGVGESFRRPKPTIMLPIAHRILELRIVRCREMVFPGIQVRIKRAPIEHIWGFCSVEMETNPRWDLPSWHTFSRPFCIFNRYGWPTVPRRADGPVRIHARNAVAEHDDNEFPAAFAQIRDRFENGFWCRLGFVHDHHDAIRVDTFDVLHCFESFPAGNRQAEDAMFIIAARAIIPNDLCARINEPPNLMRFLRTRINGADM